MHIFSFEKLKIWQKSIDNFKKDKFYMRKKLP